MVQKVSSTRKIARRLDLINPALSFILFGLAEYLTPRVNWYLGFSSLLSSLPLKIPYSVQVSISQAVIVLFLLTVLPLPSALIFRMLLWRLSENYLDYRESLRVLRMTINRRTWFRSVRVLVALALDGVATLIIGIPFALLFLYGYRVLYILLGMVTVSEFYYMFFVCLLGSILLSTLSYRLIWTKLARTLPSLKFKDNNGKRW